MVKLTFDFDKEKLLERGLTEDGMLEEVREFAKENGIEEIAYGVFARYDEHALCLLMMIAYRVLCERPNYMECLRSLELDCDGDVEECVSIAKGWK